MGIKFCKNRQRKKLPETVDFQKKEIIVFANFYFFTKSYMAETLKRDDVVDQTAEANKTAEAITTPIEETRDAFKNGEERQQWQKRFSN